MTDDSKKVDALVLVSQRNDFYKKKYHFVLGLVALSLLVVVILISIIRYLQTSLVQPAYFLANDVGSFMQEIPSDQPFPLEEVTRWTIQAVEAANSFDFVNWRAQMQDAQKYFTDYSWGQWMQAVKASNNLLALQERKWIFVPKVIEKPQVVNAGIISNHYAWKFKLLMLVTYLRPPLYDQNTSIANALTMDVIVIRQPLLQSYQGLAIYSINASLASTTPSNVQTIKTSI